LSEVLEFGKALIDAEIYMSAINIIGFNAP
jgi:hypothetical protein